MHVPINFDSDSTEKCTTRQAASFVGQDTSMRPTFYHPWRDIRRHDQRLRFGSAWPYYCVKSHLSSTITQHDQPGQDKITHTKWHLQINSKMSVPCLSSVTAATLSPEAPKASASPAPAPFAKWAATWPSSTFSQNQSPSSRR